MVAVLEQYKTEIRSSLKNQADIKMSLKCIQASNFPIGSLICTVVPPF
jgi:hypothetical protein